MATSLLAAWMLAQTGAILADSDPGATSKLGLVSGTTAVTPSSRPMAVSPERTIKGSFKVDDSNACVSPPGRASLRTATATALFFVPLPPCRLFDTRNTTGPDAASPALAAGETRFLSVTGRCAVPPTARSLSVNVTVTQPGADGAFTLWAGDLSSTPTSINLAFAAGRTRANNAIVALSNDGNETFKVWNDSAAAAHLILDVNGYFEPTSGALDFALSQTGGGTLTQNPDGSYDVMAGISYTFAAVNTTSAYTVDFGDGGSRSGTGGDAGVEHTYANVFFITDYWATITSGILTKSHEIHVVPGPPPPPRP